MINLGPALKPLLDVLVLTSAVAAPVLAQKSGTFKEHLLYCEEVVEHNDDFLKESICIWMLPPFTEVGC